MKHAGTSLSPWAKALLAFVVIPLVILLLLVALGPNTPMPTGTTAPATNYLAFWVVLLLGTVFVLSYLYIRSSKAE